MQVEVDMDTFEAGVEGSEDAEVDLNASLDEVVHLPAGLLQIRLPRDLEHSHCCIVRVVISVEAKDDSISLPIEEESVAQEQGDVARDGSVEASASQHYVVHNCPEGSLLLQSLVLIEDRIASNRSQNLQIASFKHIAQVYLAELVAFEEFAE